MVWGIQCCHVVALGYSPVVIHALVMNPEVPGIADS